MNIKEEFKPIKEERDSSESERDSVERKKSEGEETKEDKEFFGFDPMKEESVPVNEEEENDNLSPNVRDHEISTKRNSFQK